MGVSVGVGVGVSVGVGVGVLVGCGVGVFVGLGVDVAAGADVGALVGAWVGVAVAAGFFTVAGDESPLGGAFTLAPATDPVGDKADKSIFLYFEDLIEDETTR